MAERERRAACGLTDGNVRPVAYLRRVHARSQGIAAELCRLEHQRQREAARRAERLGREQQAIEEVVLLG